MESLCNFSVTKRYQGDLKPHLIRYWLIPPADPDREETIVGICQIYQAPHTPKRSRLSQAN